MIDNSNITFDEDDLSVVYFDDDKAYLSTGYGKMGLITRKETEQLKQQILDNQEIVQRLRDKINTINKHLENLERQQYTGKNLGDQELTSADYIAISDLKMKLIEELTQFKSILEKQA